MEAGEIIYRLREWHSYAFMNCRFRDHMIHFRPVKHLFKFSICNYTIITHRCILNLYIKKLVLNKTLKLRISVSFMGIKMDSGIKNEAFPQPWKTYSRIISVTIPTDIVFWNLTTQQHISQLVWELYRYLYPLSNVLIFAGNEHSQHCQYFHDFLMWIRKWADSCNPICQVTTYRQQNSLPETRQTIIYIWGTVVTWSIFL